MNRSGSDEQLVHNCVRYTKDGQADDITCADMIMALLMRNAKKRPRQSTSNEDGHPRRKFEHGLNLQGRHR